MTNPIAHAVELEKHLHAGLLALGELKASLLSKAASLEADDDPKLPDGRMSQAGISALYAEFEGGDLTNAEIAEKFDISISGVKQRRRMWREGR